MKSQEIRHAWIEDKLKHEELRKRETISINDSMDTDEIVELLAEYERVLKLIKDMGKNEVSITPLEIQLQYAKLYLAENPDVLRKAIQALTQYAAGKHFDINDIIRFVERNVFYYYAYSEGVHSILNGVSRSRRDKIKCIYQTCFENLIYFKYDSFLYSKENKLLEKELLYKVYSSNECMSLRWSNDESFRQAHYRWRCEILCFLIAKYNSDEVENVLESSSILSFIWEKMNAFPVPDDIYTIVSTGNPFAMALYYLQVIEECIGHKLSDSGEGLMQDCLALTEAMRLHCPESVKLFEKKYNEESAKELKRSKANKSKAKPSTSLMDK